MIGNFKFILLLKVSLRFLFSSQSFILTSVICKNKKINISISWCCCCWRCVHLIFRRTQNSFLCRRSKVCNYICVFAVCFYICAAQAHTDPHSHSHIHIHTHTLRANTHTWPLSRFRCMCTTFRSMSSGSECLSFLFALSPVDTFYCTCHVPHLPFSLSTSHSLHIRLLIAGRLLLIKNGRQRTAASRQWHMTRRRRSRRRRSCRESRECRNRRRWGQQSWRRTYRM